MLGHMILRVVNLLTENHILFYLLTRLQVVTLREDEYLKLKKSFNTKFESNLVFSKSYADHDHQMVNLGIFPVFITIIHISSHLTIYSYSEKPAKSKIILNSCRLG